VATDQLLDPRLRASYGACRRMQRRHDPTYYWATRWLPREVQPAVYALYGFVRSADEIVDGPGRLAEPAARRAELDRLEAELEDGLRRGDSSHPVIAALVDSGRRHDLPLGELHVYMDSMRVDCGPVRMADDAELDRYMNGSAGAVGRIMAPLLGAPSEDFARLGLAFQLTNFIRDVPEDWRLDRIYIPGVAEGDLERRVATLDFRDRLGAEVGRARELFARTEHTVQAVAPRMRKGMRVARSVYLRVLDRVEALGFDVLGRRASLPPWEVGRATLNGLRGNGHGNGRA
jgi:phytoene synthase